MGQKASNSPFGFPDIEPYPNEKPRDCRLRAKGLFQARVRSGANPFRAIDQYRRDIRICDGEDPDPEPQPDPLPRNPSGEPILGPGRVESLPKDERDTVPSPEDLKRWYGPESTDGSDAEPKEEPKDEPVSQPRGVDLVEVGSKTGLTAAILELLRRATTCGGGGGCGETDRELLPGTGKSLTR